MNNVNNCLLVANNWVFHVSVKLIIAEEVYVHGEKVQPGKSCLGRIALWLSHVSYLDECNGNGRYGMSKKRGGEVEEDGNKAER